MNFAFHFSRTYRIPIFWNLLYFKSVVVSFCLKSLIKYVTRGFYLNLKHIAYITICFNIFRTISLIEHKELCTKFQMLGSVLKKHNTAHLIKKLSWTNFRSGSGFFLYYLRMYKLSKNYKFLYNINLIISSKWIIMVK